MRHLVFHSSYDLTVDDKNRILVPSEVRKKFDAERDGEALFLVTGRDARLWLYPALYYEQLVSQEAGELTPTEDTVAFYRMMLGLAHRVEWDKQGRVLLPDKALRRHGLGKEVSLVGALDHLELWNRSDWLAEEEALNARRHDVFEKIRLARMNASQQP